MVRKSAPKKAVREAKSHRAKLPSASVDQAMRQKVSPQGLAALISEMRAELGPATEEETAWARRVLGLH